jgi:hypothetical protein
VKARLAKPAAMRTRSSSYAYEPKWDGFRALLRTEHGLRVLSRRRWNMTPLLPELEAFPIQGVFDGELIAFSEGQPDFVALCDGCCSDRNADRDSGSAALVRGAWSRNMLRQPGLPECVRDSGLNIEGLSLGPCASEALVAALSAEALDRLVGLPSIGRR